MRRAVLLLVAALMVAACKGEAAPAPLPTTVVVNVVRPDGQHSVLQAEVAATDAARERGLMFREHLEDNQGMLFTWPNAAPRSFWMHNTYIPLDMLFIKNHKVVGVISWAKPKDDTPLGVPEDSDAVLEVNGGWATQRNVGVGSSVLWP